MLERGDALDRLLDVRRARFLFPYLGRTRTISQAAQELGVSVARMSYQASRLVEVGLIERVNLIRRAGRPIVEYRSIADEFIVSFGDVRDGDLEAFLLASEEPLRRVLIQSVALAYGDVDVPAERLGLRLCRTATGSVEVSPCTIDGRNVTRRSTTLNGWHVLELSAADARALRDDLEAVLARYHSTAGSGTTHLIRVALAPIS